MVMARGHLSVGDLNGLAGAAFGTSRRLAAVERLRGGSKKGVYRLRLDDGSTAVAYVWSDVEDYWTAPAAAGDHEDPFAHASGLALFQAAHGLLSGLDLPVPELVLVDRSRSLVAADVAVVADVPGGSLENLTRRNPPRADHVLAALGDVVRTMHDHTRSHYGRPIPDGSAALAPVEWIVKDRALRHLGEAARRVPRIAAAEEHLREVLLGRFERVRPRQRYGLIHGELGPDHILVGPNDEPVLIDIEGVMFFDVEWEHAFLQLRFGDGYRHLAADGLDRDRLDLYRLALYLSLVEGPLRLLDGDFPDRALMLDIAEQNVNRAMRELSLPAPG